MHFEVMEETASGAAPAARNRTARMAAVVALGAIAMLAQCDAVAAAELPCSIRPPADAPASAFAGMSKVTQADAQQAALASFADATAARVAEGELEAEHGCLVYSFDVELKGQTGVEEVIVDAGTGKVLSREHENEYQEAAEAKQEGAGAPKAPMH